MIKQEIKMKRYIKSSVAFLLTLVILLTSYLPTIAASTPTYSTSSNSGERDEVCVTLDGTGAGSYYTGSYSYANLTAQTSSQLFTSLRTLMRSTHKYVSSYNDCHNYADQTDCENNNGKVSLIYTGYDATMSQWNGWNREHIWPKSLGGDSTTGGGADLHHIRPSDAVVNSTRGNKKYGEVSGGSSVYGNNPANGCLGGYTAGNYFEPLDNVKGDVARICLYVYVRWGSDWGATSITSVFQSVDVLLEWCALDPVDTWEMGRNEVVEDIQGNRNVFIDYPELAWLIFDRDVPSNMTTPSGNAANGNSGNQGGNTGSGDNSGNQGGNTDPDDGGNTGTGGGSTTPEVCTHKNTEIRNFVAADCKNDGYSGDVYCKDCGELISEGDQVQSDGSHKFGEWETSDDGKTFVSSCTVCGAEQMMTVETLIASLDSDAEKILILLTLGISDIEILDALSK